MRDDESVKKLSGQKICKTKCFPKRTRKSKQIFRFKENLLNHV